MESCYQAFLCMSCVSQAPAHQADTQVDAGGTRRLALEFGSPPARRKKKQNRKQKEQKKQEEKETRRKRKKKQKKQIRKEKKQKKQKKQQKKQKKQKKNKQNRDELAGAGRIKKATQQAGEAAAAAAALCPGVSPVPGRLRNARAQQCVRF
eukprot:SAG31_NODE_95_length_25901_cov_24.763700_10_plen_151_part_00